MISSFNPIEFQYAIPTKYFVKTFVCVMSSVNTVKHASRDYLLDQARLHE